VAGRVLQWPMSTKSRIERAKENEPPPEPVLPGDKKRHWIYVFAAKDMVKVGITCNVDMRLKSINHASPFDVSYYGSKQLPKYLALWTEGKIMAALSDYHIKGEWFSCTPDMAYRKLLNWHAIAMNHTCKGYKATRSREERR